MLSAAVLIGHYLAEEDLKMVFFIILPEYEVCQGYIHYVNTPIQIYRKFHL